MSAGGASAEPTGIRINADAGVLVFLVGVFALAAGYDWLGTSRDHANYFNLYNNTFGFDAVLGSAVEPGYMFTVWLCKIGLGMSYSQHYTILAATSLALKFRLFWKRTDAPVVAAIVYLMLLYPIHEYTQIRAAVSFAFTYTAIDKYLDGRWRVALALLVVAASFHYSAIVLAAAAAFVLFVSHRSHLFVAASYLLIAIVTPIAFSELMHLLEIAKPAVAIYVRDAFVNDAPDLLSGENIRLFIPFIVLILCSALFLRPMQTRRDGFYFLMGILMLPAFAGLVKIPALSHRVEEMFVLAFFFFTFRFDASHQSRIPAVLMILLSGYMLYEAFAVRLIAI